MTDHARPLPPPRIIPVGEEPPPMEEPDQPPPSSNGRRRNQSKGEKPKGKTSSKGRFQCVNAFLDVTMAELDRAAIAVWLLLWRDTKSDGLARSSQSDLARWAGCTARSVRRALVIVQPVGFRLQVRLGKPDLQAETHRLRYTLIGTGLVTVVRQGGLRSGMSVYRVRPLVNGRIGCRFL